jgi:NAD(P)-dependent dehydrogenase (short-subunit alcohol dehydrogenase family)
MSWSDYWKPLLYHQWFTTLPIQTKSFSEQTIIVTGSTRGLGLEAARLITNLGAKKVILAVRNIKLGETVRDDIEKKTGKEGVVEVWPLDLCSYESVKEFAEKASKLPRIDVLLLNAAIYKTEFTMAEVDETTITTNIVSNFLLGLLLLPKLKETSIKFNVQPTLEIVTSEAHWIAEFTEKAILIQYSSHLETKKKVVNVCGIVMVPPN